MPDDKLFPYPTLDAGSPWSLKEPQATNLISSTPPPPDNRRFRTLLDDIADKTLWPRDLRGKNVDIFIPTHLRMAARAKMTGERDQIMQDTDEHMLSQGMMMAGVGTIKNVSGKLLPKFMEVVERESAGFAEMLMHGHSPPLAKTDIYKWSQKMGITEREFMSQWQAHAEHFAREFEKQIAEKTMTKYQIQQMINKDLEEAGIIVGDREMVENFFFKDGPNASLEYGHVLMKDEMTAYMNAARKQAVGKTYNIEGYKSWRKKEIDPRLIRGGEHINVYHGKPTGDPIVQGEFYNYQTLPDDKAAGRALDQVLGAHFAEDPGIPTTFTFPNDAWSPYHQFPDRPEAGTYRSWEELATSFTEHELRGGYVVPVKLNVSRARDIWQPSYADMQVQFWKNGMPRDQVSALYRSMFEQGKTDVGMIWDQGSVVNDMWVKASERTPYVFNKWFDGNLGKVGHQVENILHQSKWPGHYGPEWGKSNALDWDAALERLDARASLYELLRRGRPVPKEIFDQLGIPWLAAKDWKHIAAGFPKGMGSFKPANAMHLNMSEASYLRAAFMDNPFTRSEWIGSMEDFIRFYDAQGSGWGATLDVNDKRLIGRYYTEALAKEGYDAVRYLNTSPKETGLGSKNRACYIVWNPADIKVPWAGFKKGTTDYMRGAAGAAVGAGAYGASREK